MGAEMEPGGGFNCAYRRNGADNLFVFLHTHRHWRRVKVTDPRIQLNFARRMRELVNVDYPGAPFIRVVTDNLNRFGPGVLRHAPRSRSEPSSEPG